MKKRYVIYTALAILFIYIFVTAYSHMWVKPSTQLGNRVLATVDGVEVPYFRLMLKKYLSQNAPSDKSMTDEKMIKLIIEEQVVLNEAFKLGLVPGFEDAQVMSRENYDSLLKDLNSDDSIFKEDAKKELEIIDSISELSGFSVDELINDYLAKDLQIKYALDQFFRYYLKNYKNIKLVSTNEFKNDYLQYIQELVEKADVEVFNIEK